MLRYKTKQDIINYWEERKYKTLIQEGTKEVVIYLYGKRDDNLLNALIDLQIANVKYTYIFRPRFMYLINKYIKKVG